MTECSVYDPCSSNHFCKFITYAKDTCVCVAIVVTWMVS